MINFVNQNSESFMDLEKKIKEAEIQIATADRFYNKLNN